jgi:ABC-2 type transport system permease protein
MPKLSPRTEAVLTLTLVAANLVALNLLVAPLRARLDLTEQREYTISAATRRVLNELPDTVEVYGYFSSETHPKLKPLIPMIGDVLEEFRVRSLGKVMARVGDPKDDPLAEKEAYRRFNVRATPFSIDTQYERGVKSAYFSLVVAFGEHYVKLDFGDLIEVQQGPNDTMVVKLRSIEYQLTSAIDRVVREFSTPCSSSSS